MAVTLPEVNNVVPLVKEPQYRVGPGQVAAPMLELAQNLDKAAKETGDVSVLLAHQAGLKAVSRDENGNVTVEHPPIVGPAAIQYQHAVTMAAAADGESVAKLDFVKLRDQHRDDPQGFMTAAQAYRKEKVGQYEKAAGADVGLALGRTIDSLAVENYRGLLNQKESRDLQNSYAAITAQIETTKNELFAIANGGADKNDPAFRQRLQKIGALYGQLTNNPRMGLPREKADYEITQIAAELDVAAMDSKVRDIQFAPADKGGGIEAAYTEAEKIRTDPSLNLTPGQRQAAYSRLIGGIQQRVNAQTQVDKGATAAIKTLEDTAAAGLPIPPAQMATVEQIAIQSGNPGVQLQLQNLKTNAPIIEAWRKQSPEQIERNVAEVERVMQDPSVGATSQLLALRNAGEALAKNARAAIKIDPIGWGNRTGAVPSAPIDLTQPATMQARIASAETVAGILRQAPVYLTPDERTAIEAAVAQGGKPMTDVAQALVTGFGDRANRVMREVSKESPVLAHIGSLINTQGSPAVVRDAAEAVKLRASPEFIHPRWLKTGDESAKIQAAQNPIVNDVYGDAFLMAKDTGRAAFMTANSAFYTRSARQNYDPKFIEEETASKAAYKRALQEAAGATYDANDNQFGGVWESKLIKRGFISGTYGRVLVPGYIRADRFDDVIGALRDEDVGGKWQWGGKTYGMSDVQKAIPVAVQGGYRFSAGDPGSEDPKWIPDANGRPLTLDLGQIEPVLRKRVPGAFSSGEQPAPSAGTGKRSSLERVISDADELPVAGQQYAMMDDPRARRGDTDRFGNKISGGGGGGGGTLNYQSAGASRGDAAPAEPAPAQTPGRSGLEARTPRPSTLIPEPGVKRSAPPEGTLNYKSAGAERGASAAETRVAQIESLVKSGKSAPEIIKELGIKSAGYGDDRKNLVVELSRNGMSTTDIFDLLEKLGKR